MSFSIVKAGHTETVLEEIRALPGQTSVYQVGLAKMVRDFIQDVLDLSPAPSVIVEASGHDDSRFVNVSVSIRPAF